MEPWQSALVVIGIVFFILINIAVAYYLSKRVSNKKTIPIVHSSENQMEQGAHKKKVTHSNELSLEKAIYDQQHHTVQTPLSPPKQKPKERRDMDGSFSTHYPIETVDRRIFSLSPIQAEDEMNSIRDSTLQSRVSRSSYVSSPVSHNTPTPTSHRNSTPLGYNGPTPPFTQHPGRTRY